MTIPATRVQMATLRQKVRDALVLAVAAKTPWTITESLGTAAGMLEALADIPSHELVAAVIVRADAALDAWTAWHERHTKVIA